RDFHVTGVQTCALSDLLHAAGNNRFGGFARNLQHSGNFRQARTVQSKYLRKTLQADRQSLLEAPLGLGFQSIGVGAKNVAEKRRSEERREGKSGVRGAR